MTNNIERWLNAVQRSPDVATGKDGRMIDENEGPSSLPADVTFISELDAKGRLKFAEKLSTIDDITALESAGLNAGLRQLVANVATAEPSEDVAVDDAFDACLVRLYEAWGKASQEASVPRHLLLTCLAQASRPLAWHSLAELLSKDPPTEPGEAIEALVPLWRTPEGPFEALFPRLLESLSQPVVAPLVLDLTNFLFRSSRVKTHPAADRLEQLGALLGRIVERLEGFEQQSRDKGVADLDVAKQVTESVSLATSLCDTLVVNDYSAAMGKLYRMMELRHRRLRIEAAAGLAKFGEEAGIDALVETASEPFVRLRVLEYARELDLSDRISKEFRSPLAVAEAELVVRLAEPDLFGVPPLSCELVDQTTLHWPGYEEPRDCYLFRFRYQFARGEFENFGIAGPVAHALAADLTLLPLADCYGAFAGWHAEHPELQRYLLEDDANFGDVDLSGLLEQYSDKGYEQLTPEFGARYFGEHFLVASAQKQGKAGILVANPSTERWVPHLNPERPMDANAAYSMVIGRDMLNRFNHGFDEYQAPTS